MSKRYFIDYQNGTKNFYMPCDITHYTAKKYFKQNFVSENITKLINQSDILIDLIDLEHYYQDLFIQLYNGRCYINLYNETKAIEIFFQNAEFLKDLNVKLSTYSNPSQSKGGNLIGAPDGSFIFVDGLDQNIINFIQTNSTKKMIKINCSFKAGGPTDSCNDITKIIKNNFRHIDELLCFMPYGKNQFKIWFYDKFTLTTMNENNFKYLYNIFRITNDLKIHDKCMLYENSIVNITNKMNERTRILKSDYDYISQKQHYLQLLNELTDKKYSIEDSLKILDNKIDINKHEDFNGIDNIKEIQEVKDCLNKKYDLIKNKSKLEIEQINLKIKEITHEQDRLKSEILSKNNFIDNIKQLETKRLELVKEINVELTRNISFNELNEYINFLNCEREKNLEILSTNIFGGPYKDHTDKFVFFNYDPAARSLFNRLWYETPEKTICLFPKILNIDTEQKIIAEMENVKSYISDNIPVCHFILDSDIPKASLQIPEGTLHCMIKQRFVKP
jgi:hypothetical protein